MLLPVFRSKRQTAAIAATAATRAKPMATRTSVFKLSIVSDSLLALASRSAGVKAASLIEFNLAPSSSRVVLSLFTAELTVATSDLLAAVVLRAAELDCKSLILPFSASRTGPKTATSVLVAVVTLRESKLDCMFPIAVFNEFKSEFRAVMFASMSSSLALSVSIAAKISSIVAGSASTVTTVDDAVTAEIIDAIMSITKNVLL